MRWATRTTAYSTGTLSSRYVAIPKDDRVDFCDTDMRCHGDRPHSEMSSMGDLRRRLFNEAAVDRVELVQGYVKAPLSARNGIGALSVGMIVDHTFEI